MRRSTARHTARFVAQRGLEWLCVTVAFASVVVHAGEALHAFVAPRLDSAFVFLAAFVLAGLLGLRVESPKALIPMTVGMLLVGASVYGGVIYAPVWLNITLGTVQFQNYATQQALLIFFWGFIPAIAGAIAGNFAGAGLRARVDRASDERTALAESPSWWDRASDREA